MKKLLTCALLLCVASPAIAELPEIQARDYIELVRSDIKTKKKAIIATAMNFSEKESKDFWPVYEKYDSERTELANQRIALIKDFAKHYEKMTDTKANQLIEKALQIDEDVSQLKRKYASQFGKVLTPIRTARLMQIENQLEAVIRTQVNSELPLIKEPSE